MTRAFVLLLVLPCTIAHAQDPWERRQEDLRIERANDNYAWQQARRAEYANDAAQLRRLQTEALQNRINGARLQKRYPIIVSSGVSRALIEAVSRVVKKGERLTGLSFAPNGGFAFTYGRNGYFSSSVPPDLLEALQQANARNDELRSIAFTADGGWVFLINNNGYQSGGLRASVRERLFTVAQAPERLTQVSFFGADGFLALIGDNGWNSEGLPATQIDALKNLNTSRRTIRLASPCPRGWLLVHGERDAIWNGAPDDLAKALQSTYARGVRLQTVSVAPNGSWIIVGDVDNPGDPSVVR